MPYLPYAIMPAAKELTAAMNLHRLCHTRSSCAQPRCAALALQRTHQWRLALRSIFRYCPHRDMLQDCNVRFRGRHGRHQFERYPYPTTIAWAVTILRFQGFSLDRAVTDLGPEVRLHGQPCTALITVRSMAGVILVGCLLFYYG